MKHILVAGSTGSGKSVCLNAMLISLICKYSPQDLRLILIDPKKVEFAVYDGLPHLMINEIIADAQKAVAALNWAIKEMERRYQLFEQKTRNGKLVRRSKDSSARRRAGKKRPRRQTSALPRSDSTTSPRLRRGASLPKRSAENALRPRAIRARA